LIGGFAVQGFLTTPLGLASWRWMIWPLLILGGFTLAFLLFTLPETSAGSILARRAQRLRLVTGNPHLRSRGEVLSSERSTRELITGTLLRPWRLGLLEPISLCINLHIGLVYGVLYS
jgi:DHA1 family multidrug resistance protein-like MFS transporter